jgi:hypothetical protein
LGVNTDPPLPPNAPNPADRAPPPTRHLRCIGYALRTLLRVLPALGRNNDHANPPPGLAFKHFAIAGVICAVVLVGSIVLIVNLVLQFALAK